MYNSTRCSRCTQYNQLLLLRVREHVGSPDSPVVCCVLCVPFLSDETRRPPAAPSRSPILSRRRQDGDTCNVTAPLPHTGSSRSRARGPTSCPSFSLPDFYNENTKNTNKTTKSKHTTRMIIIIRTHARTYVRGSARGGRIHALSNCRPDDSQTSPSVTFPNTCKKNTNSYIRTPK